MSLKTSVALCIYNGASFIKEQLNSIAAQSCRPDEIIVCDDQSSDDSLSIVENWKQTSEINVSIYKNSKNIGFFDNFQKAISLCSGDIIFLCDQDDIWETKKVETIINYFKDNKDKDVVFTNGYLLKDKTILKNTLWEKVGFDNTQINDCSKNQITMLAQMLYGNFVTTGATMAIRKEVIPKFLPLFPNDYYFHDYLIALNAAVEGRLGLINECLIQYRIHESQRIGIKETNDKPNISQTARKAIKRAFTSEIDFVALKSRMLQFTTERLNNSIPDSNRKLLKDVTNHFQKREKIIRQPIILGFLPTFAELLLGKYKYSSQNQKTQIKLAIKDIFSTTNTVP